MKEIVELADGSSIEISQNEEMGPVVQIGIVLSDDVIASLVHDNAALWEEAADILDAGLTPAQVRHAVLTAAARFQYRGVFTQLDEQNLVKLQSILDEAGERIDTRETA